MSDWKKIKYDVHAHRAGLETKHHRRLTKVDADYLKVQYEGIGFSVAFSLNQEKNEDLFGEGIYG